MMDAHAFVTLDDVVTRLAALERRYLAARDRRAVFATVYGLMSREMKRRIEEGAFRDCDWVARYTIAFANLYRDALDGYERGDRVPKSWAVAFETAKQQSELVSQDLLLGINAHVNHDLALALHHVSIEPDRAARHEDHTRVNELLRRLTDVVADRVSELYARGLASVDACAGTLDEEVTNFSFAVARENAWEAAVALTNARGEIERGVVRRLLDLRSASMARLILAPNRNPQILAACRAVEAGGWWEALAAAHSALRQ
jgi:hypothetical protein